MISDVCVAELPDVHLITKLMRYCISGDSNSMTATNDQLDIYFRDLLYLFLSFFFFTFFYIILKYIKLYYIYFTIAYR